MLSVTPAQPSDFHSDLKAILPRLRAYAMALTRNRDHADDLVQETVVKALAGRQSFHPGTCFAAWIYRIERNEFISGVRRQRPSVPIDDAICNALSHPPHQEGGLVMREFLTAFGKLNVDQREALVLSVIDGQAYEQIARQTGVSVGTVKSRVSRARDTLERLLVGADEPVEGQPRFRRTVAESRRPTASSDTRVDGG